MSAQKRPYQMRRRAELEEHTRRRITESAVALHEQVGPARTSISAIAEHAGVRRSTVYRHFPNEVALFDACSSHFRAANPPPDPNAWLAIDDPAKRTAAALGEMYAFYGRTHRMYASLLRDESVVPIVRTRLRDFYGYLDAVAEALMKPRRVRGPAARRTRAAIRHALAFATWHSLTGDQELALEEAVSLMCRLIESAADADSARRPA